MSPDGAGGAAERKPVKLPAPGRASEAARRLETDICDIPGLIRIAAAAAAAAAGLKASERKLELTFPETWEEEWCVQNRMLPDNDHIKNNKFVKHVLGNWPR